MIYVYEDFLNLINILTLILIYFLKFFFIDLSICSDDTKQANARSQSDGCDNGIALPSVQVETSKSKNVRSFSVSKMKKPSIYFNKKLAYFIV